MAMTTRSISSGSILGGFHARPNPITLDFAIGKRAPIFLVTLFGNMLEYFEYTIYGFLAPILALHFFTDDNKTTSLIKAFSVIAVGSFAKPLGALIFGYLGDARGRSITLKYTMIGIAIPTFIVGILPGYDTWGWRAITALILCRMFQGIFMAAESDGVRIYIFEHFGQNRPCLISAAISCSAYAGMAAASFVASHVSSEGNGWRWAFLGSSLYGLVIYFLRRHMVETPPFLRLKQTPETMVSLKTILKTRWRSLIRTIMICGAVGGIYHFNFVFQCTYLSKVLNLIPNEYAPKLSFYLICLYVLVLPFAGWSADRFGYVRVGKLGGIITIGLAFINLVLIHDGIVFLPIMILITMSMPFFVAPAYLFLTQQYDVKIRFRSFCLGHAIGSMIFSGTTPVVCLFLWQTTGFAFAPFIYFLFLITIGITAFSWRAKENAYNAWFL
jgi:MHS family proline/betaine transporter-like MFS transporter